MKNKWHKIFGHY